MKNNTLRISTVSVLCMVLYGMTSGAIAAGTVKTLGGAGTYNGTSAASTSTRSAPTRAGSLRVSPSSARMVGSGTSSSNGTATSTGSASTRAAGTGQRLSIGKYLGSSVTTASSVTAENKAAAQATESAISNIEDVLDKMRAGDSAGIIGIDLDGSISIDLGILKEKLADEGLAEGDMAFEYDSTTGVLTWTDSENHVGSIDITKLEGAYDSIDELESVVETLATKSDLDALSARVDSLSEAAGNVVNKQPKSSANYQVGMADGSWATLTQTQQDALNSGVSSATVAQVEANKLLLDTKADKTTVNGLAERINSLDGDGATSVAGQISAALADYTTTADMNTALDAKANSADLAVVATSGSYNDLSDKPTKLSQFENDTDYANKTELKAVSDIVSTLTGEEGTATPISEQITSAINAYAEGVNTALDGKQASLSDAQLAAVNSGITSEGVAQIATNKTDIADLKEAVSEADNKVSNLLPSADLCINTWGNCVLTTDSSGKYIWVGVIDSLEEGNN